MVSPSYYADDSWYPLTTTTHGAPPDLSRLAEEKGKLQLLYVAPERLEQILGGHPGAPTAGSVRSPDPPKTSVGDAEDQPTYNWKNHQAWSLING